MRIEGYVVKSGERNLLSEVLWLPKLLSLANLFSVVNQYCKMLYIDIQSSTSSTAVESHCDLIS